MKAEWLEYQDGATMVRSPVADAYEGYIRITMATPEMRTIGNNPVMVGLAVKHVIMSLLDKHLPGLVPNVDVELEGF